MTRDLPTEYEIPEEHLMKLNRLCGRPEENTQDKLPPAVGAQYINDRIRADKIGIEFSDNDLWSIVCRAAISGKLSPLPLPEKDIVTLWRERAIVRDDIVLCKWRNNNEFTIPARIQRITKEGRPVVQFLTEDTNRTLPMTAIIPAPPDYTPPVKGAMMGKIGAAVQSKKTKPDRPAKDEDDD